MKGICVLLVWTLCCSVTEALKLPSYITPCNYHDPNIDDCILKAARATIPHIVNGDPKYKVPPIDPIVVKELYVSQGTGSVGLTMAARDALMRGVKDVEIRDAKHDFKNKKTTFEWFFPELRIDCIYNVTGNILLLNIEGYGNGTIKLRNVVSHYKYDWELTKKNDGKHYYTITKTNLTFEPERFSIYLDNLFHGNKLLGENMNRFMNENWKEILKDVGPVLSEAFAEYIRQLLNNIYSLVPFENAYTFDPL